MLLSLSATTPTAIEGVAATARPSALASAFFGGASARLPTGVLRLSKAVKLGLRVALIGLGLRTGVGEKSGRGGGRAAAVSVLERRCKFWLPQRSSSSWLLLSTVLLLALRVWSVLVLQLLSAVLLLWRRMSKGRSDETLLPRRLRYREMERFSGAGGGGGDVSGSGGAVAAATGEGPGAETGGPSPSPILPLSGGGTAID